MALIAAKGLDVGSLCLNECPRVQCISSWESLLHFHTVIHYQACYKDVIWKVQRTTDLQEYFDHVLYLKALKVLRITEVLKYS